MQHTGLNYEKNGRLYPLTYQGGLFFIFDPKRELQAERQSVAAALPAARGLGDPAVQAGFQVAAQAAGFIPVVGPFLSAALSVAGSLFGGGDPTALSILMNQIVQLRGQIAAANNAMGRGDSFVIPAGFDPTDKDGSRDLVDGIVEEVLGTSESEIQGNRRPDYYSAIKALQNILTATQAAAHDQALVQTVEGAVAQMQGGAAARPATGSNFGMLAALAAVAMLAMHS